VGEAESDSGITKIKVGKEENCRLGEEEDGKDHEKA